MTEIRNYILDDDVLEVILCDLPIKQLLRFERVSEQFKDCVQNVLKKKTGIRLGKKIVKFLCSDNKHSTIGGNIRRSVKCHYNKLDLTYHLDISLHSLQIILKKCPNIKSLYLAECRINEEVLQFLVDNCKQLKCLTLSQMFFTTDMEEWKRLTDIFAKMNLKHLAIADNIREYNTGDNLSVSQKFSNQINYLVQHLPTLEQFRTYSYSGQIDTLLTSLPTAIKSLHLYECYDISMESLILLNSLDFPLLSELVIEFSFCYNREENYELEVLHNICLNLNLDNLVFFSENDFKDMESLFYPNINKLTLKRHKYSLYSYDIFHCITILNQSVRSLYLVNFTLFPNYPFFEENFPQLSELTFQGYKIKCYCYKDMMFSDGESKYFRSISPEPYSVCDECHYNSVIMLSQIPLLKRLVMHYIMKTKLDVFEYFVLLPTLELFSFENKKVCKKLAQIFLSICQLREHNSYGVPLLFRSDEHIIKKVDKRIREINDNIIPKNLKLRITKFKTRGFKY